MKYVVRMRQPAPGSSHSGYNIKSLPQPHDPHAVYGQYCTARKNSKSRKWVVIGS